MNFLISWITGKCSLIVCAIVVTLLSHSSKARYPSDCEIIFDNICFEVERKLMTARQAQSFCEKRNANFQALPEGSEEFLTNALEGCDMDKFWVSRDEKKRHYYGHMDESCYYFSVGHDMKPTFYKSCSNRYYGICQYPVEDGCKLSELKNSLSNVYYKNCDNEYYEPSQEVTIECKDGYILQEGPSNIKCQLDGKWSHNPRCSAGCPPPPLSNNSFLLQPKKFYTVKDKAYLMCKSNFISFKDYPITHVITTCLNNSMWSDYISDCYPVNGLFYHYDFMRDRHFELKVSVGGNLHLNVCKSEYTVNGTVPKNWNITWSKDQIVLDTFQNEKRLTFEDFSIKLLNFSQDDQGVYTCLIRDIYTNSVINFCTYQLGFVKQCPEEDEEQPRPITLQEGTNQLLRCTNQSYVYKTRWMKNEKHLWEDEQHILLADGSLFIQNVSISDEGLYECEFNNADSFCNNKSEIAVTVKRSTVCGRLENSNSTIFRPWIATLWNEGEVIPFCYATLIHPRWLLTSATCLFGTQRRRNPGFSVKLGATSDSFTKAEFYNVSKVKLHPQYSKRLSVFDIALIKLSQPVVYTNEIYPICFLEASLTNDDSCDKFKSGTIVGWGPLGAFEELNNLTLKTETLNVVTSYDCNESVRFQLPDYMFCAKGKHGTNEVAGDSGSSFEVQWKTQWYLWGVLSWGDRAYEAGEFDYFSKTINFRNWVQTIINSAN